MSSHTDRRGWLVLSLKWSGEHLVWYRTASAGYTTSLLHAGRYTEAEARQNECTGEVIAVPLEAVSDTTPVIFSMHNTRETVDRLRAAGRPKG